MGIHYYAAGDSVSRAQHYVPGFARHPRQGQDLFHGLRNFSPERFHYGLAGPHDRLSFISEKSRGADFLFQFGRCGVGEIFRFPVFLVQLFGDLIDPHVGALRRQNCGNQQLKRIFVVQFANRVGISFVQLLQNGRHPFGICPSPQAAAFTCGLFLECD